MTRPVIVLIPGLMCDGAVWAAQTVAMSRLGPVFVACNDGLDSLDSMAARIADATAGPLFVVGHSMGGRVALELVARVAERVVGLALLSTGAHGARASEAEGRARLVALAHSDGMAAVAHEWLPGMMAQDAASDTKDQVRSMVIRCAPSAFDAQQQALLSRLDRTALLPRISCPTLVATGENDAWASPAQHAEMASKIMGSKLTIVEGAGHMLPLEAPERLNDMLIDLWDDVFSQTTG